MPDVAEWFYAKGDKQIGPVTLEALGVLAVNGELTPQDLVWRNGTPDWKRAGEVRELFEPDDGQPEPAKASTAPTAGPVTASISAPAAPRAARAAQEPIATTAPVAAAAPIAAAVNAVMGAPAAMATGAAVMSAPSAGTGGYAGPHMDPTWDDREGASESEMPIPTYVMQSLFCTLFSLLCGIIGLPFALAGMFYAAQVGPKLRAGDLDSARNLSDKAKLWCRLSFWLAFGLMVATLYFVLTGAIHPARVLGNNGIAN